MAATVIDLEEVAWMASDRLEEIRKQIKSLASEEIIAQAEWIAAVKNLDDAKGKQGSN
jgi:hypothetical protein